MSHVTNLYMQYPGDFFMSLAWNDSGLEIWTTKTKIILSK